MRSLKQFWDWIKKHKFWLVCACIPVAFGLGYLTLPPKIETEIRERVKVEEKIVKQVDVQVQEKVKYVEVKGEERVRIVYRETKPDGTKIEREEERNKTDIIRTTELEEQLHAKNIEIKNLKTERETLKKQTSSSQPRLMLGLSAGYDASPAWLKIPTAPNLALGVEVKVRVVGPLWIGASAYQTGLVAGTLSVAF